MNPTSRSQIIKSLIENGQYITVYEITRLLEQIGISNHGAYYSLEKQGIVIPLPELQDICITSSHIQYSDKTVPINEESVSDMIAFVNSN